MKKIISNNKKICKLQLLVKIKRYVINNSILSSQNVNLRRHALNAQIFLLINQAKFKCSF